jgi:hypothetical protein
MQVANYTTMTFATLGPSELRPPFTGGDFFSNNLGILPYSTGQASGLIFYFAI